MRIVLRRSQLEWKDVEMKNVSLTDLMAQAEVLSRQGQVAQVIALYQAWIQEHSKDPLCGIAWFNLGTLWASLQKTTEAEQAYRASLVIQPQLFQARLNLGHALENQGKTEEALQEWQRVLHELDAAGGGGQQVEPLQIHALNNLARALETLRRYDESEVCMLRSLDINPDQSAVLQHYVHIRQKQCEWPVYVPRHNLTVNRQVMSTSALAMLAAYDDPALQLMAAREFVHAKVQAAVPPKPRRLRQPDERIRIGYVSGDLCMHAVGLLTVELFELHDRNRFEVFGFCWSREDKSPLRARIVKAFDHHIRIGHLTDEQAAQVIESCGIDILVDLQGLTSGARPNIFMHRPAGAVQISYLGLPGTSALPTVDYILADDFVYPPELEPFMTEQPLRVPHCYQVSDRQRDVGPPLTRAVCGLPEDKLLLAAFNNNYKITADMFACWMRILQQVPNSILWMMADNRWSEHNLRQQAAAHGVDANRLFFAGRAAPAEYMARLALPDLFLDTLPYNAGTTANDILWMGSPILTCSGRTYISRMCGSLLTAVGLPDLVTFSLQDYERQAVLLGQNPQRLASYKRYLKEYARSSRLFDIPSLVKDLEQAFVGLLGFAGGLPVAPSVLVPPSPVLAPTPAASDPVLSPTPPLVLAAESKKKNNKPGKKTEFKLRIEGWRGINHSFALVNQFQLLEMVKLPGLKLKHVDFPFHLNHWNNQRNAVGFYPRDEKILNSIPNKEFGQPDVNYRIAGPLDLRRDPKLNCRQAVFAVSELGFVNDLFVPEGGNIAEFEAQGGVIITPSRWSRERLVDSGFQPETIKVISHAASPQYFFPMSRQQRFERRRDLGIAEHEVVLLNIGSAMWNKGFDVLVKAFAIVRQTRKDLRLIYKDQRHIYGFPGDKYLESILTESKLWSDDVAQAVIPVPLNLTMDQMNALYTIADCYVAPYRAEGFCLPVCEAMTAGVPVIATAGGATDDFLFGSHHQKIESKTRLHVKIENELNASYCEPSLQHLVQMFLEVGQKPDTVARPPEMGWKQPTSQLIDVLKELKI